MSVLNAGHLQEYRQKPKWQEGRKSDLGFPVPYWSHITLSPILTSGTSVNPLAALKPSRRLLFLHFCVRLENNQALFLFNLLSAQLICTEPFVTFLPTPWAPVSFRSMETSVCSGEQKTKEDSTDILLPILKLGGLCEMGGWNSPSAWKTRDTWFSVCFTTCFLVHWDFLHDCVLHFPVRLKLA